MHEMCFIKTDAKWDVMRSIVQSSTWVTMCSTEEKLYKLFMIKEFLMKLNVRESANFFVFFLFYNNGAPPTLGASEKRRRLKRGANDIDFQRWKEVSLKWSRKQQTSRWKSLPAPHSRRPHRLERTRNPNCLMTMEGWWLKAWQYPVYWGFLSLKLLHIHLFFLNVLSMQMI